MTRSLNDIVNEALKVEEQADIEVSERNMRRGRFIVESRPYFKTAADCIEFWQAKYSRSHQSIYHYAAMVGGFVNSTIKVDFNSSNEPKKWNKPWQERKESLATERIRQQQLETDRIQEQTKYKEEIYPLLIEIINLGFAQAARRAHPDTENGSTEKMHLLNEAKRVLMIAAGGLR